MNHPSGLLAAYGIAASHVYRNAAVGRLYEDAIRFDGAHLTSTGALATRSGSKCGRSPQDKRIVDTPKSSRDVWWGPVNIKLPLESFHRLRHRAIEALSGCQRLYVVDGFAGWDPKYRLRVRVICSRPYHALFMHNMLIRTTPQELAEFGEPDLLIINAGAFAADAGLPGVGSETCVSLDLEAKELVILGTEYAGEMKKGVFTAMHYLMPKQGVLSMHCSATQSEHRDVSLFFGLSGTGKTTLSADPRRKLIGDDEHCWTDSGVFNIEGGCYAKCIRLREASEPQIYRAIRFGTVLENTVCHPLTREIDFDDDSITENTRAAYPVEFIDNVQIPCVGGHPRNIIFLTCDAFGVLPPVSKLTPAQAMYHFISGYTAKVAGTEVGIQEPVATFSACYGAAFLVWHPQHYAELLEQFMRRHNTAAWLVNTGWTGGPYSVGQRMSLNYTRSIIDAIHSEELQHKPTRTDPVFGLEVPTSCTGVPSGVLFPQETWPDAASFDRAALELARRFHENFTSYLDAASPEIRSAAPRLST
jgi:phosphoenolpyruvate carboxykinase (ATP)